MKHSVGSVDAAAVSWEELRQNVYEVDGTWRDIYVLTSTWEDWETWSAFVNANYRVEFIDEHEQEHDQINFTEVWRCWELNGNYLNSPKATVFVGDIYVHCRFFQKEVIENDINPQQINSYAVHLQLMAYMTGLSRALGKEVVLTAENDTPSTCSPYWEWSPILAVNNDQIKVYRHWADTAS